MLAINRLVGVAEIPHRVGNQFVYDIDSAYEIVSMAAFSWRISMQDCREIGKSAALSDARRIAAGR